MHAYDTDGITETERHRGRHRAKKDTKRWCGGKPGRAHQIDIRLAQIAVDFSHRCTIAPYARTPFSSEIAPGLWWMCWEQRYCTTCGKMFGYLRPAECTELERRRVNGSAHLPVAWRGGVTQEQVDAYYGEPTPIVWVSNAS